MAGWMVGSVLLSWIACSALNAFVENQVSAGSFERQRGFVCMVAGLLLILALMLWLCLTAYPLSAQATSLFLTPDDAARPSRIAAFVNGLFIAAYAGFQLRRYWDDR